jgi:hypothetical protein
MEPALEAMIMHVEGELIIKSHNHIPDSWPQARVIINFEMHRIICPNMYVALKLVPSRQEDLLTVLYYILAFMAILVLALQLLCPAISHLAYLTLCCH